MFQFIITSFKNQKKKYFALLFSLIIMCSFQFTFLSIYETYQNYFQNPFENMPLNAFVTTATFVAFTLSIMLAKFFINDKKQEFATLLLSGKTHKYLMRMISIQIIILLIIAFGIGGAFGLTLNNILSHYNQYLQIDYTNSVLLLYILFMLLTYVFIAFVIINQIVTLERGLCSYLSSDNRSTYVSKKTYYSLSNENIQFPPILKFIYIIFIIYIIIVQIHRLTFLTFDSNEVLFTLGFLLVCIFLLIHSVIPLIYDMFHTAQLLKHPILINTLSSFIHYSSVFSIPFILNAVFLPLLLLLLLKSPNNIIFQSILVPCSLMIFIMVGLSYCLKYLFAVQKIKETSALYHAVGYNKRTLSIINKSKVALYSLFIILIPLILVSILTVRAVTIGVLTKDTAIIFTFSFILFNLIMIIYMSLLDQTYLKEATHNAKYLTRS